MKPHWGSQDMDLWDHDFICDLDSWLIVIRWLLVIRIDGLKVVRYKMQDIQYKSYQHFHDSIMSGLLQLCPLPREREILLNIHLSLVLLLELLST